MIVPGGVKRARSQRGADWLTGRGGITGLETLGGASGSGHQGGAGDREVQGGSEHLGEATEGRAKGLKGTSRDRAEELAGVDRRGGSGRLGGTIRGKGDLGLEGD